MDSCINTTGVHGPVVLVGVHGPVHHCYGNTDSDTFTASGINVMPAVTRCDDDVMTSVTMTRLFLSLREFNIALIRFDVQMRRPYVFSRNLC